MPDTREEHYNKIIKLVLEQGGLRIPCQDTKTVNALRANLYSYRKRCERKWKETGEEDCALIIATFDKFGLYKQGTDLLIEAKEKEKTLQAMQAVLSAHGEEHLPEAMTEEERASIEVLEGLMKGE